MPAHSLRLRGLVQGVGFRPYAWRLANELGLRGWVRNDGEGVVLAVDGEKMADFLRRLPLEIPPLARVDSIETLPGEAITNDGFIILESAGGSVGTAIGPDAAICPACIADLCDPDNRRWRYALTTCTHCGPRFTVSAGIPYDRARTSLAPFPLCPTCAAEYADPANRRFHAETTCCPDCGPSLRLLDAEGVPLAVDRKNRANSVDPIAATLALLRAGNIVAIKGLGGFHLACDARNADTVAELRQRKQREEKPFALMGLNAASLAPYARLGDGERALFDSREAPIVLCPKGNSELPGIAPGLAWLGVMRPATPLHLLLWHEAAGRPAGTDWLAASADLLLVMTSANPHGEPLVIGNDEALERLAGIADAYLLHDRDIVVRCDDSVVKAVRGEESGVRGKSSLMNEEVPGFALTPHSSPLTPPRFIRRARGYVPVPVPLADDGPSVLALGAYLKNTVCVLKGRAAFLSQHIGGLDKASAIGFLEETVAHLLAILDVRPDLVAHDLHPDFPSTQLALRLADQLGVPAIAVGHHHAHIAAIAAEHRLDEPLIGLALDGVGLGTDGGAWGGELLRVDGADCRRLGHLRPLALPGGDRAAREPWRLAAAALDQCGRRDAIPAFLARRHPGRDGARLVHMLERRLNCPETSSLGRLFDAAAGLLGLRGESRYEGQAAMEMEGLAAAHGPVTPLAGGYRVDAGILDFSPLLATLADCDDAPFGAALFHATVAAGLAAWAIPAVNGEKTGKIAVGGGCAMNAILMAALREHLDAAGIKLLEARQAPPNDGGLALGQGWVARRTVKEKH
jgi:hydrogenase maturation protein HypF